MLISILFGIAIATLTYRYLGGTENSEFRVGALKLAGSAAMLLGTALLTNYGLSKQMTLELRPNLVSELQAEVVKLRAERSSLENKQKNERGADSEKILRMEMENRRLAELLEAKERELDGRLVALVAKLTPDSDAGKRVLDLYKKREGPFSSRKRFFDTVIRVVDKPRDANAFFACSDLKLAGEDIQLTRLIDGSSDSVAINAKQQGTINDLVCSPKTGERAFSMQISCEGGKTLFPDHISGCGQDGGALWVSDKRNFDVRIEVLSDLD
jgi:hypothetical protein